MTSEVLVFGKLVTCQSSLTNYYIQPDLLHSETVITLHIHSLMSSQTAAIQDATAMGHGTTASQELAKAQLPKLRFSAGLWTEMSKSKMSIGKP